MWVVHGVGVQPLVVLWGKQDATLVPNQLTEEVLLLIVVDGSYVAWKHDGQYHICIYIYFFIFITKIVILLMVICLLD